MADGPLSPEERQELERAVPWCDCGDNDESIAPLVRRLLASEQRLREAVQVLIDASRAGRAALSGEGAPT